MYLLFCAVVFALMAIPERHRYEWAVLAVLVILLWCNKEMLDRNGDALYFVRASLVFVGASLLVRRRSFIGFYQAVILLCILGAYGALAYDMAHGEHILIYDSFGDWIHGFVACQLLGVLPDLWTTYRRHNPSGGTGRQHLPRNKRA